MKRLFVLIPLVLMLAACGNKETISFKGVLLGKPNAKSSLVKLCSEEKRNTSCELTGQDVSFLTTFGKFQDGKFQDLSFPPGLVFSSFILNSQDEVASIGLYDIKTSSILESIPLLEEKYGKPEIKTTPVRNKLGSAFEQKFFKWKDAQGNTLCIWSINEKIDEGSILFRSAAEEARVTEEEKQTEKTAKSNL